NALFRDRAEANEELRRAREAYQVIVGERGASDVARQRATHGLARTLEALNELDEARETYQKLVTNWPQGPYADEARNRIKDLERRSTKEFYDWFAMQDPRPRPDPQLPAFGE